MLKWLKKKLKSDASAPESLDAVVRVIIFVDSSFAFSEKELAQVAPSFLRPHGLDAGRLREAHSISFARVKNLTAELSPEGVFPQEFIEDITTKHVAAYGNLTVQQIPMDPIPKHGFVGGIIAIWRGSGAVVTPNKRVIWYGSSLKQISEDSLFKVLFKPENENIFIESLPDLGRTANKAVRRNCEFCYVTAAKGRISEDALNRIVDAVRTSMGTEAAFNGAVGVDLSKDRGVVYTVWMAHRSAANTDEAEKIADLMKRTIDQELCKIP